jgi:putative nucleotidyltransferase with HDIG domain
MTKADDILQQVASLPPLPDTALKLMSVVSDPRSSVDQIVEAIRYDQAVTGQVLKLCNSAYFGLSRRVTSLNDAMVLLGTVKVLQLVMSVHTSSMLSKPQDGYGLEPGVLWRHSVAVAIGSSLVATRFNLTNVNLAFTAGLLHDIGKVVLNQYVAAEFREIIRQVTEEKRTFAEAEQEVLGFSHCTIGAALGEQWSLPEPTVNCIRYHHYPSDLDPPDALVDTVYLANTLCVLLGIGVGEDGLSYRADAGVMERHNLTESDLELLGIEIMSELTRVEQSFAEQSGAANLLGTSAR